jgi:hypothetical protein
MLSSLNRRLIFPINNTLNEYCYKSTQESIQKQILYNNLARNKVTIDDLLYENKCLKRNFNLYGFVFFLSISTIGFLLYKRLR